MTFAVLKVKLNNTDVWKIILLKIEVGLCCVPYEEIQSPLKNVSLSKMRDTYYH